MATDDRPRCCVCGFPGGHKYNGRDYCGEHLADAVAAVVWLGELSGASSTQYVAALLGAYTRKGDTQCPLSN